MTDVNTDVSVQQMRTFVEVVKCQSYTTAAEKLRLAVPTVWQHVRKLETSYGMQLISRKGRSARVTERALFLAKLFSDTLSRIDSIPELVRQSEGAEPKEFCIASGLRMFFDEVGVAIEAFHERHPEVVLKVLSLSADALGQAILEKRVDLAVTARPERITGPWLEIELEPAYEIDMLLIVPTDHALTRKKRIQLKDVVKYPLILWPEGLEARNRVMSVLTANGLDKQISVAAETGSTSFTLELVRRGIGIGLVGGMEQVDSSVLLKGLVPISLSKWFGVQSIYFAWRRGVLPTPLALEFAELIRKVVGKTN